MVTHPAADNAIFRAVADPTRRDILTLLRRGRQPAGSIADLFPISRPAVSKHLRLLRQAKLVREVKEGRNRHYELNPEPLKRVDDWLSEYREFWSEPLENLKQYLENEETEEK